MRRFAVLIPLVLAFLLLGCEQAGAGLSQFFAGARGTPAAAAPADLAACVKEEKATRAALLRAVRAAAKADAERDAKAEEIAKVRAAESARVVAELNGPRDAGADVDLPW